MLSQLNRLARLADRRSLRMEIQASVPAQVAYAEAAKLEAIGALKNAQVEALALLLKGRAGVKLPNGRMAAKENARFGISKLGSIRDDSLNGQLGELLGDVCVLLGHWQEAPDAYREAIPFFRKCDAERKVIVEKKVAKAIARQADAASWPWPHPNGRTLEKTTH